MHLTLVSKLQSQYMHVLHYSGHLSQGQLPGNPGCCLVNCMQPIGPPTVLITAVCNCVQNPGRHAERNRELQKGSHTRVSNFMFIRTVLILETQRVGQRKPAHIGPSSMALSGQASSSKPWVSQYYHSHPHLPSRLSNPLSAAETVCRCRRGVLRPAWQDLHRWEGP